MSKLSLDGKVALVTGASRGIGASIARALSRNGADVAVNYHHDRSAAERICAELSAAGAQTTAFQANVARRDAARAMVEAVAARFGRIDILVNNAGIFGTRPFGENDPAFIENQFQVNAFSVVHVTEAAVAHMPQPGGRIVNVSSNLAAAPRPGTAIYSAAKAAVDVITRGFAMELGPRGITVNAVAPGVTRTDMTSGLPDAVRAMVKEATPLRRLAEPDDIADIVAFLVSDQARWITGRTILTDGGAVDH